MRKKLYLFPLFLLGFCLTITSCLNNDDGNDKIDEEWKSLQENYYNKAAADNSYNALSSQSGNGKIYWKASSVITDSDKTLRITANGTPEFTDTVAVRYEGWYFDKTGEKIIFDSTENPSLRSNLAYSLGDAQSQYPNKKSIQFAVSGTTSGLKTAIAVLDGTLTLLQDMTTGEEREVVIPQELGYKWGVSSYTSPSGGSSYVLIPAYTTLWFRVKLMKIIPMSGLSS